MNQTAGKTVDVPAAARQIARLARRRFTRGPSQRCRLRSRHVVAQVLSALTSEHSQSAAARSAGISEPTFRLWLREAQRDSSDGPYAQFAQAVAAIRTPPLPPSAPPPAPPPVPAPTAAPSVARVPDVPATPFDRLQRLSAELTSLQAEVSALPPLSEQAPSDKDKSSRICRRLDAIRVEIAGARNARWS